MEEYPCGCGVVAAHAGRSGGLVLHRIEVGASIGHTDLPVRQSLSLRLDFRFSLEELVLSRGRHVVFPLLFHEFLNEGLLLDGPYLLLRLLRLPPRITHVIIESRSWYFAMNFRVILKVMSSLGDFAFLFLLIFVLIFEGGFVLGLDLISLNSVIIDAVCATVHVGDAYHLVKTNKL